MISLFPKASILLRRLPNLIWKIFSSSDHHLISLYYANPNKWSCWPWPPAGCSSLHTALICGIIATHLHHVDSSSTVATFHSSKTLPCSPYRAFRRRECSLLTDDSLHSRAEIPRINASRKPNGMCRYRSPTMRLDRGAHANRPNKESLVACYGKARAESLAS